MGYTFKRGPKKLACEDKIVNVEEKSNAKKWIEGYLIMQ